MKNSLMLLAALALAGCAEMQNRPNMATPGTTYVQQVRNTGSFGKQNVENRIRVAGERMWQGRKAFVYENTTTGMSTITDADTGRWIAFARGDTPISSFDPPVGYNYPLSVGDSWSSKHRFTDHVKKQGNDFVGTWKVEAFEDVTVPAGTFKAYKVVYSSTTGLDQIDWWSPEIGLPVKRSIHRSAKHAAGVGTSEMELVSRPAMP
jgi:hypothetical protein